MSESKIYIDPNEDIVFACSRIMQAPARQVIIIAPQGSNIISSRVSMKLLARILAGSEKLVVLVTEDELGHSNAEKVGISSALKISDVSPEHWKQADEWKKKLLAGLDSKKAELVSQIKDDDYKIVDEKDGTDETEDDGDLDRNNRSKEANNQVDDIKSDEEIKPLFKKLEPKVIDLKSYAILSGGDIDVEKQDAMALREKILESQKKLHDEEEAREADIKPENAGKKSIVEIEDQKEGVGGAGMEAVAGGATAAVLPSFKDRLARGKQKLSHGKAKLMKSRFAGRVSDLVKNSKEYVKNARDMRRQKQLQAAMMPDEDQTKETKNHADVPEVKEKDQPKKQSNPVGNQYTSSAYSPRGLTEVNFARGYGRLNAYERRPASQTPRPAKSGSRQSGEFIKNIIDTAQEWGATLFGYLSKGSFKKKMAIGGAVFFLLIIFLLFSSSSKAAITLTVEQQNIPISESITADESLSASDAENLKMPMRYLTKTDSRSETRDATGKGESGNKATGTVTIYNGTANEITLNAGTVLTCVSNSLDYVLKSKVVVAPLTTYSSSPTIEASSFGEEYNLSTGGPKQFTVKKGAIAGLSISTISGVSGGSKKEVTVVSKEDLDNLKKELSNLLKESLKADINGLISDSELRLGDNIIYGTAKVEANKKEGDKSATFDMTVTLEAKIPVVDKQELNDLALALAKKDAQVTGDVMVDNLENPQISNITVKDKQTTFKLDSIATITPNLDLDTMKTQIQGKGLGDAKNILQSVDNVKQVSISYSPGFRPGFMKKVPKNNEKITITVVK